MDTIFEIVSISFGYMFLSSCYTKVKNFEDHVAVINSYQIVPVPLLRFSAYLDISCEILLGVALFIGLFLPFTYIFSAIVLFVYSIAIFINLRRGRFDLDCGCGGIAGNHKISYKLIYRNLFLILLALFIFTFLYSLSEKWTYFRLNDQWIIIQTLVFALIFAVLLFEELISFGQLLKNILKGEG